MFKVFKVRSRLLLILTTALISLLLVGSIGYYAGKLYEEEVDRVYLGGPEQIQELHSIYQILSQGIMAPAQKVLVGSLSEPDAVALIRKGQQQMDSEWQKYATEDPLLSAGLLASHHLLLEKGNELVKNLDTALPKLEEILQQQQQQKEQLAPFLSRELFPLIDPFAQLLNQFIEEHLQDSKNDYLTAQKNSRFYQMLILLSVILAIAFVIPLTIAMIRGIVTPVESAIDAIGLSQDIGRFLSSLSSGATETASAVTETTTTVEELKQTSNMSVQKAKDVLANSEETLKTVVSTEQSVQTTIQDINQIRDRMQIISDSILKLSETSLAISEIMDSVNDIAEQSNLLAVNAAIEASKAGELGRGFSVVAQEIRTLAEQSKGATVQVRSLLGEIRTATNTAVMATEQGTKAVTKGVDQSMQTKQAIKEVATKVKDVTQAANQILLSNQQQLIGTEQITIAISQINEATNQHVAHLHEIEEAVANWARASEGLKSLTDKYQQLEDQPRAPRGKKPPTLELARRA